MDKVRKLRTDPPNDGTEHLMPFCATRSLHLDIFSYIENSKGELYCPSYSSPPFPKEYIDNISSIKMYDKNFSAPSNISDYLIIKYGSNFETSNRDRVIEHLSKIRGGVKQNLFSICDIEWDKSKISYEYRISEPLITNIQVRTNELDGKIIYNENKNFYNAFRYWLMTSKEFGNYHTLYLRINKGDEILFYQKIVYSTDIRTFNMYKFMLKKFSALT